MELQAIGGGLVVQPSPLVHLRLYIQFHITISEQGMNRKLSIVQSCAGERNTDGRSSRWHQASCAGLLFGIVACSQTSDPTDVRESALVSPTDPLQFEVASDWHVTQGRVHSLSATTIHSQGASALAVTAPQGYTRLDSVALSSTHPQLARIDAGATLNLDLQLPTQQANPFWFGAVQAYISAPSRNVYNAYLGQVELTGMRTGIYTTLHFRIPDAVASALKGATYSDLTIGVVINVPNDTTGVYIVDNLRVKGPLPPPPTDASQIAEGQSVLVEASRDYAPPGAHVASQTFAAGVIQIPQSFHLIGGRTGNGTATFELKLGTASPTLCTYTAATSLTDYVFGSCVGGARSGDLIPADFVRLTVVNGDPAAGQTRIKAQIALNPVGDELATGLPAIPTFFGTTGAEVQATLNAFVQQQRSWQITDNEIVHLPTPAIAVGAPVIRNDAVIASPPQDNDPPFSIHSRLTGSDLADAGWHVNGSLAAPVDAVGARDTHFDVDLGVDIWLLTANVNNVIGLTGSADTHTPAFDGTVVQPTTSTAQFCYQFLGIAQVCKGPFNATTGLDENIVDIDQTITLLSVNYWVFHVGASGHLVLKADLSGGFTPNGLALTFQPHASLGARLEGGLAVGGFLGGGVFADVTLVAIDAPITAQVNAVLHAAPSTCNIHVSESLNASVTISTGGGQIGYYIEGGLTCGFFAGLCWRDEGNLFSWPGAQDTFDILPAGPLANQDIPLPRAVCTPTGLASGGITYPVVGEVFNAGDTSFLDGGFFRVFADTGNDGSDDGGFHPSIHTPFDCHTLAWSSSAPDDVVITTDIGPRTPGSCFTSIKYSASGVRTLTLTASDSDLGNGLDTRTTTVLVGDPATAPVVTMTRPVPFEDPGNCGNILASGSATDPGGLATTLAWFEVTLPAVAGTPAGTGPTAGIDEGEIVRLVATNSAGQKAAVERPVSLICVK